MTVAVSPVRRGLLHLGTEMNNRSIAEVLLSVTLALVPFAAATAEGANVGKTAQKYISEFRNGVEYSANDRVLGIVINGRIAQSTELKRMPQFFPPSASFSA